MKSNNKNNTKQLKDFFRVSQEKSSITPHYEIYFEMTDKSLLSFPDKLPVDSETPELSSLTNIHSETICIDEKQWENKPDIFFYSLIFANDTINRYWQHHPFSYLSDILMDNNLMIYNKEISKFFNTYTKLEIRYIDKNGLITEIILPSFDEFFKNSYITSEDISRCYADYLYMIY